MSELVVLVPSRGRPQTVRQMWEAFNETCTADTVLAFVIDNDDIHFAAYRREAMKIWEEDWEPKHRPLELIYHYPNDWGKGMVAALNRAAMNKVVHWPARETTAKDEMPFEGPPFAVGFMGDDHRPRTEGWDERYLDALYDGSLFVYGNDLLQGATMPTQVAMRSDVVSTLGKMAPEFGHLCIDLAWKDWGQELGRIAYLDDVVVEHLHPAAGKAQWDDNYNRVNNQAVVAKDSAAYFLWKENDLPGELDLLWELP